MSGCGAKLEGGEMSSKLLTRLCLTYCGHTGRTANPHPWRSWPSLREKAAEAKLEAVAKSGPEIHREIDEVYQNAGKRVRKLK
jgi:hypothetical protein